MGKTMYNLDINTSGGAKMSRGKAKQEWDRENAVFVNLKFMRKTEAEMLDYLDAQFAKGIARGTLIKKAIKEYMTNHPAD